MKNLKPLLSTMPEIYLLLAVGYYWTLTPSLLNPVAIGLIALLLIQLLIKKHLTGIVLASVFICINLFLLLALYSEFSEFPAGDSEGMSLLTWGVAYLGLNLVMSGMMLVKHAMRLSSDEKVQIAS